MLDVLILDHDKALVADDYLPNAWDLVESSANEFEKPLNMIPPPTVLEWVVKKTKELSRKMKVSFTGIEYMVEELFCEIERRRHTKVRKCDSGKNSGGSSKNKRELLRLECAINYDRRGGELQKTKKRRGGEQGGGEFFSIHDDEHLRLEC